MSWARKMFDVGKRKKRGKKLRDHFRRVLKGETCETYAGFEKIAPPGSIP